MIAEQVINDAFEHLVGRLRTSVLGIGMDVETNRGVHPDAARFFLTDSEREWLKEQPGITSSNTLLRLWTVKEAIFKADPDNGEKIIGEYILDEPSAWAGSAYRRDCRFLQFHYTSIQMHDGFLSIAISAKGDRNA